MLVSTTFFFLNLATYLSETETSYPCTLKHLPTSTRTQSDTNQPATMARTSSKRTETSQVAPAASSECIVTPIDKDRKTFFDLPGEIRNQIYCELLPDVPNPAAASALRLARHGGQKTSTTFMATCKAVYQEASSLLYRFLSTTEDAIEIEIAPSGFVRFLGPGIDLADAHAAKFAAIKRVKKLHLCVSTRSQCDHKALCDVQDAMFIVLGTNLRDNHVLQSLDVRFYTPGENDGFVGMFSLSYADRIYPQTVMREFTDVRPGDVSRAHVAAFLSDPLRTIRGVKDGKKKGKFTLDFIGKGGRPWRNIQGQVRGLIQGKSSVPNYTIFCDYFSTLRQLRYVITKLPPTWFPPADIQQLAEARVHGDVEVFLTRHKNLLIHINQISKRAVNATQALTSRGG